MTKIVVAVPMLGRPDAASRLEASLRKSEADARLLFVCSPHDKAVARACHATGAQTLVVFFDRDRGDFARKINTALTASDEPWLLIGASDLEFHRGWDDQALRVAGDRYGVIGTNDLGNPYVQRGHLATHALVRRTYAEEQGTIDEKGKILHEGYWHNWVDAELTETAKARDQFVFARRSIVEHLHPHWGKGVMDATYELGLKQFHEDKLLLQQRRHLWAGGPARRQRLRR